MRVPIAVALIVLVSGCENMQQKVQDSRQDRCQRADWALVGERDGIAGHVLLADRYEYICAEMFQPGPYRDGYQKGLARKPRPAA